MTPKNTPAAYRINRSRGGWYVENTATGAVVMTGMARMGAVQLADRLNARSS